MCRVLYSSCNFSYSIEASMQMVAANTVHQGYMPMTQTVYTLLIKLYGVHIMISKTRKGWVDVYHILKPHKTNIIILMENYISYSQARFFPLIRQNNHPSPANRKTKSSTDDLMLLISYFFPISALHSAASSYHGSQYYNTQISDTIRSSLQSAINITTHKARAPIWQIRQVEYKPFPVMVL